VRASGGGARSSVWRQIQADVTGYAHATINVDEGPALGAAILAGVGAGAINALVGSGTLITFPTLVTLGFPPVTATMSNAVGLVAGAGGNQIVARVPPQDMPQIGKPINLTFDPASLHFFDPQTGARIA